MGNMFIQRLLRNPENRSNFYMLRSLFRENSTFFIDKCIQVFQDEWDREIESAEGHAKMERARAVVNELVKSVWERDRQPRCLADRLLTYKARRTALSGDWSVVNSLDYHGISDRNSPLRDPNDWNYITFSCCIGGARLEGSFRDWARAAKSSSALPERNDCK
jgi:hypothetical protein